MRRQAFAVQARTLEHFGALNKHSFMSIMAAHTKLIDCKLYQQSYGHGVHLHQGADGVLIKDCFFTGTLRPTNDIYKEKRGRATEYDFYIMYRGKRKIPRDQMIPLTEDAVRTCDDDKNIRIINVCTGSSGTILSATSITMRR